MRHPSFQGIRSDKPARQITRELPASISITKSNGEPDHATTRPKRTSGAGNDQVVIAGVALSNPDRVLYPEQGITKQQLAEYYEAIADWIIPHVIDRPLAVVRCPRGHQHKCFFQKHISEGLPESIHSIAIRGHEGINQTLLIKDLGGLIGLVQLGVLEIHPWGSRADEIEKPDRITFDLDPGPNVGWHEIRTTAILVHDFLADLGLESYVKTSGGKGLHVVVPIARRAEWDEVKAFTGAVAKTIAEQHPGKYVTTMTKSKREGKIFIDYFRNSRGATSVAPYSTRARHGAPVSTPLAWKELSSSQNLLNAFNVENLQTRMRAIKDPWKGFFESRPPAITATMKRTLKLD